MSIFNWFPAPVMSVILFCTPATAAPCAADVTNAAILVTARTGYMVAALACDGQPMMSSAYDALVRNHRQELTRAQSKLVSAFRNGATGYDAWLTETANHQSTLWQGDAACPVALAEMRALSVPMAADLSKGALTRKWNHLPLPFCRP